MTAPKIAGALGLCRRAGKLAVGAYAVLEKIAAGKAAVVLLASDAAENTRRRVAVPAEKRGVPVRRCALTKEELGRLAGRRGGASCASVPAEFLDLVLTSM